MVGCVRTFGTDKRTDGLTDVTDGAGYIRGPAKKRGKFIQTSQKYMKMKELSFF
jgi:hypothetical protein